MDEKRSCVPRESRIAVRCHEERQSLSEAKLDLSDTL